MRLLCILVSSSLEEWWNHINMLHTDFPTIRRSLKIRLNAIYCLSHQTRPVHLQKNKWEPVKPRSMRTYCIYIIRHINTPHTNTRIWKKKDISAWTVSQYWSRNGDTKRRFDAGVWSKWNILKAVCVKEEGGLILRHRLDSRVIPLCAKLNWLLYRSQRH